MTARDRDAAPMLHVVAVWLDGDQSQYVAEIARGFIPSPPEGFARGQVVTFALDQADRPDFRRTMERLDLAEVNERGVAPDDRPVFRRPIRSYAAALEEGEAWGDYYAGKGPRPHVAAELKEAESDA